MFAFKWAFKRSNLVFYYILVLSVIIMKILEIFPRQSLILTIIGITFVLFFAILIKSRPERWENSTA